MFEVDRPISRAGGHRRKHKAQFPDTNVVRSRSTSNPGRSPTSFRHRLHRQCAHLLHLGGRPMYLTRSAVTATLAVHELSTDGSQIAHDMWYRRRPRTARNRRHPAHQNAEPHRRAVASVHPEDYTTSCVYTVTASSTSPSPPAPSPLRPDTQAARRFRSMSSPPNASPPERPRHPVTRVGHRFRRHHPVGGEHRTFRRWLTCSSCNSRNARSCSTPRWGGMYSWCGRVDLADLVSAHPRRSWSALGRRRRSVSLALVLVGTGAACRCCS